MNAVVPMKSGEVATVPSGGEIIEQVIAKGDLSKLTVEERTKYYMEVCKSVGLNPLTRPFEYIELDRKLTLYCRKDATDQLRDLHGVSIEIVSQTMSEDCFVVHARATDKTGRRDEDFGAVELTYPDQVWSKRSNEWVKHPKAGKPFTGKDRANGMMKAVTKAKRRLTLSISGLGFPDESEIDDIPAEVRDGEAPIMQRLSKAQAKPIYTKLQAECDGFAKLEDLQTWTVGAEERLKLLPADWHDTMELRIRERLLELRQKQGAKPAETVDPETGEITEQVIWTDEGEPVAVDPVATAAASKLSDKPGQAALERVLAQTDAAAPKVTLNDPKPIGTVRDPQDIPDNLKRLTPNQEGAWLALIKKVCGEAPDTQALMDQQSANMSAAQQRKVSSAGWVEAVRIFRERMQYLIDHPVFDAEVWLKGDLAGALSGAETLEQLTKVKDTVLIPEKEKLKPEQWKRAVKAYRDRLDEVDPQNALAGG